MRGELVAGVILAGIARVRRGPAASATGTLSKGLERLEPARRREIFSGSLSSPMRVALGYELAIQQLLQGSSFCEQETLPRNASEREQGCNLGLQLDSFRHGIEPQRLAQRDDGAREFWPLARVGQAADEGPVDLEDVDREAVEVR
jgi:hypothetical protein